ncbi:MAG: hypothetical protein F6K22_14780 [Okeania sp. SIO2F4]|uniref:hypothetical protein n=1 Tax=Okeania sp. SIO2F4 TaxID=2607790 RepID=UPI001429B575|nr:hypothetical protein [Okeania sp. SIO2F4]NES03988.1 hypothetical protein [Okeania sp. SIO2F4]
MTIPWSSTFRRGELSVTEPASLLSLARDAIALSGLSVSNSPSTTSCLSLKLESMPEIKTRSLAFTFILPALPLLELEVRTCPPVVRFKVLTFRIILPPSKSLVLLAVITAPLSIFRIGVVISILQPFPVAPNAVVAVMALELPARELNPEIVILSLA